ncbi:glycoside hydrolase family 48 protein [Streptomyces justiciae]|uniref:glycoside hydrolase family 48 protein n=1 Tax=Streptomyces justiciae TaxID=2780140 RepID=UPI001880D2E6|nr:glycoside hydrolase family 48 protein [Streptomyces justiciae]MBE8475578.1 cellulose binding domain-containing protein [Streptomyces justiciae]
MDPGRNRRAAFALPLSMLAVGPTPAQAAGVECSVDYRTNDWGSGFTVDLTLANRGTDAINGWTVTFGYTGNQKLVNGPNGTWSQSGQTVTVQNASYNATIAAGAAVTAGAQFGCSGTNAAPTPFAVNGTPCNGAHQPPMTVLPSPKPGAVYTKGDPVPLAATAAAADNATISKVEFYDDTTLLGTDTTAPYPLSASDLTVGSHSLVAKAYDSLGASGESTPVGVTVAAGPALVLSPSQLAVQQGKSGAPSVKPSTQPASNVTLSVERTSGNTGLSVTSGSSLTFTPSNWNTAQQVTVTADSSGTGAAPCTASATGYAKAAVTVTELAASKTYDARFLDLYGKITNPANGYFSPQGIPYHSVETLIVEAPDHGHETTSEAYGYLLWLQAMYGRVTGDWSKFNGAWGLMEKYMIPTHADQPTSGFYNASKPATYALEADTPNVYPVKLDASVSVGTAPIADELKSAYGTDDVYGMHCPTASGPSYLNTCQRGPQESVREMVPQPTCDAFKYGGKNGYLDLFTGDSSYAKQWKYTDAPDADARAVQAAYWADVWAKEQGKGGDMSATVAKAAKMGDYLRYAMFDKYFKKIGNCVGPSTCPAGTGKDASHYLLSWYYADLMPKSATGAGDWSKSLQRQIEFYRWLQSDEGAIAGGATNSWQGRYATPPSGTPAFYGMYYDEKPVYHDPSSNQWFGFQAWSMERVAELYQQTGNAQAKQVLDKWVKWALSKTTINPDGAYQIPSTLQWSGKPDTWNASSPGANSGLHVTVADYTNDVGVAAAYAKTLASYGAKSGYATAKSTAKALLDGVPSGWTGTMPNGDAINASSTFLSLRSFYKNHPAWSKIEAYLKGGAAPVFTYHRFWVQADIALAMGSYAELLE